LQHSEATNGKENKNEPSKLLKKEKDQVLQ
jgi:hypothetical protein